MSYDYHQYEQELPIEATSLLLGVAGILLAVSVVILVLSIAVYVFEAVGIYSIAKRRGIKNPWLAWIPIGDYWIVGSIADQYRYVARGQVKNRRVILLSLSVANSVLSCASLAFSVSSLMTTIGTLFQEMGYGYAGYSQGIGASMAGGAISLLVSLLGSIVSIILVVFWYISLYDLYTSCDPKNNTLFLVLGIIFPVVVPFFLFACRKKDLGMPPKKQPVQPSFQPVYEQTQAEQPEMPRIEPWEQNQE